MKKAFINKVTLCILMTIAIVILLQSFSFAKSENIQMVEKSEKEYIIYVQGLLNEEFDFAFSNNENEEKNNLAFKKSALDKEKGGNHIAYIDSSLYSEYFDGKKETFIWVKCQEEYKLEAEKIILEKAFSEEEIKDLNNVTKKIEVTVGDKHFPEENVDGVTVNHKVGILSIVNNEDGKYSYKMVKVTEDSEEAKFIELANKMNGLKEKDIFEQLSLYQEFQEIYSKLEPKINDNSWLEVTENIIEQPKDSKKDEQYLVWIKKETDNDKVIDVQIMTCKDEYTPEYEKKDIVIKETTKLPITGDDITLFIIAGIILILILVVVVLKIKNKKIEK